MLIVYSMAKRLIRKGVLLAVGMSIIILPGCEDTSPYAPVEESQSIHFSAHQTTYRVRPGDSLYAVAFLFDRDYQQLAAFNHLHKPYTLYSGQIIYLQYPPRRHQYSFGASSFSHPTRPPRQLPIQHTSALPAITQWSWPAYGTVISKFFPAYAKKGIEIAGKTGDGIYASAPGIVAYAGNGITGYGNLILIKHSSQFLTAYGFNARNLVQEGQRIQKGQRIADMGKIVGKRIYAVHFEIRKAGKPVDPLNYLQRR